MSTQPIGHKAYSYTYRKPRRAQEDVDFPLGPEQAPKRQETVAASADSARDRIRSILADLPLNDGNRLSFLDVREYRDSLNMDWSARVAGDLKTYGVDTGRTFRLVHDSASGEVFASSDHPDKAKIDQYLYSEADSADEFKRILQLGKMVDVAERRLSPDELQTELSPEAMAWWFDSNMDASALFSGGGIVFGMGNAPYKGLDIRV